MTEWQHRIVLYRRLAEIAGQYLRKGSQVYVEGRLKPAKWQDNNGRDRYTTEIQGDNLQMLGGRNQEMWAALHLHNQHHNRVNNPISGPAQSAPAPYAEPPMDAFG